MGARVRQGPSRDAESASRIPTNRRLGAYLDLTYFIDPLACTPYTAWQRVYVVFPPHARFRVLHYCSRVESGVTYPRIGETIRR